MLKLQVGKQTVDRQLMLHIEIVFLKGWVPQVKGFVVHVYGMTPQAHAKIVWGRARSMGRV